MWSAHPTGNLATDSETPHQESYPGAARSLSARLAPGLRSSRPSSHASNHSYSSRVCDHESFPGRVSCLFAHSVPPSAIQLALDLRRQHLPRRDSWTIFALAHRSDRSPLTHQPASPRQLLLPVRDARRMRGDGASLKATSRSRDSTMGCRWRLGADPRHAGARVRVSVAPAGRRVF